MQMAKVSSQYGAPMGRHESTSSRENGKIRVFKVKLDSGGYDNRGAYWGLGQPLYCIDDPDQNVKQFVRAYTRFEACALGNVDPSRLLSPLQQGKYSWQRELVGQPLPVWALYRYNARLGEYNTKLEAIQAGLDNCQFYSK